MEDSELYETVMDCLLNGAPEGQLTELLYETAIEPDQFDDTETSYMSYVLKMEEFLDSVDIYAFKGWEDAELVGHPRIERFWVTTDWKLPAKSDLEAGLRIIGNDKKNRVLFKRDGEHLLVRVKVLRRILDNIWLDNVKDAKERAEERMP